MSGKRLSPGATVRKSPGAASRYAPPAAHPITSPLLSALGSTTNTAAQYTSDWTNSLPFFTSPQRPVSVAGSPPGQIPVRGGRDPLSASPPAMKPNSHPNNAYGNFGGRQQPTQQVCDRRQSMYSQYTGQQPSRGHAPLPHEDQPHYYGLPDLDSIGQPARSQISGLSPGENGYFCGWDTMGTSGHQPSISAENILIVGYEGGIRVYRVSRKSTDPIGHLENLRGSVIGAKILPWTFRQDPGCDGRPYIALTIHGPVLEDLPEQHNSSDESAPVSAEESSPEPSQHRASRPSSDRGHKNNILDVVKYYQTTVEVYSLSTQKRIAVVYSSPKHVHDYDPLVEYKKPAPIGNLKVDANGKFLVVASGTSGEVFVFSAFDHFGIARDFQNMRCVGKFWTAVQSIEPKKQSSVNGSLDISASSDESEPPRGIPLFSLSHRWLALVPPTSTVYSLNGTALLLHGAAKPPGLANQVAPVPGPTTCAVDIPDGSELVNRLSRQITQNALKGAKYIGEQGYRVFNNYWNPPVQQGYAPPPPLQNHFPPTHDYSNAGPAANNDPTQVAIIDLQRILDYEMVLDKRKVRNVLTPLATFELPSGCSFLSFAPSGIHMITVSKNGDEQFVWSLMKMRDPRSAIPGAPPSTSGPYVRQIKKFARMTKAHTVDIVWSCPHGERFAILTDKGTVHAHEIPASVFQWPPLRRARRVKKGQKLQTDRPVSPQGRLSSAVSAFNGAGAWIKTARTNGISRTVGLDTLGITPSNLSSKALKAGFKSGIGVMATSAQVVYHAGDNKLHLNSIITEATPGCMRWMTGRDRGSLSIVAGGSVYIYSAKQTSTSRKGQPPVLGAKISRKATVFHVHNIPDCLFAPAFVKAAEARANGVVPSGGRDTEATGAWKLKAPPTMGKRSAVKENWHSLVEAETNPPYQPFHTDRRVSLLAFGEGSHNTTGEPWLFGGNIPGLRVIREGGGGGVGGDDDFDDIVRVVREGEDGEVIVGTTVRRRGREEEEFFEDDCEVIDFVEDRV
ncbi:hypothetical protein EJ08DRAFT_736097 [Tothia fuscella]|uniref:Uncharacterized protein n=1 Tax=Tothia fuscella TaxID=1048955 RepID=A0A9P4TWD6_9PEZI|nr:hypothetical protein EJ08DRAFT_736097 [Tothia fuscella]